MTILAEGAAPVADEDNSNPLVNEHSTSPWVWVHLGLTVVTAGLWLPVWLFLWLREAALDTTGMVIGAGIMAAYRMVKKPATWLARTLFGRLPASRR